MLQTENCQETKTGEVQEGWVRGMLGMLRLQDGTSWNQCVACMLDGRSWNQCLACMLDGTSWNQCFCMLDGTS